MTHKLTDILLSKATSTQLKWYIEHTLGSDAGGKTVAAMRSTIEPTLADGMNKIQIPVDLEPEKEADTSQPEPEPEPKPESAKEKRVKIRLPVLKGKGNTHETVGVNGKLYSLKRGEILSVPEAVVEVLRNAIETDNVSVEHPDKTLHLVAHDSPRIPFEIIPD